MRKVCEFTVRGVEPSAWSVPEIGNKFRKDGTRYGFTTRRRKTNLEKGIVSLRDWQTTVHTQALKAMAKVPKQTGPIFLRTEFYARTPPGHKHGEIWNIR